MLLRIRPDGPEPIYQQIVQQVRTAVARGQLQPGERIPSHREIATQLVINHLTVKRAFDALEQEGVVTTRRGLGTYIVDILPTGLADTARQELGASLSRAAETAHALGLGGQDWLKLAQIAWKESR